MIEKDRRAASLFAGLNVAPTIAHHDARAEVHAVSTCSVQDHSGLRFSACAPIVVVVIADPEIIDRQSGGQPGVDGLHAGPGLGATRNIWLICHDNEHVSSRLEPLQCRSYSGQDIEFLYAGGRMGFAIANYNSVDHSIPVEEDGAAAFPVDSHLV